MERGRRDLGGPQQEHGQEGWKSLEDGVQRNVEALVQTKDVVPRQSFVEGRLAKRPDQGGRAGRPIEVFANFFLLHCGLERAFHFDVDIKQRGERRRLGEGEEAPTGQQILSMKLCRSILKECSKQHGWPSGWVYDGKKNIYTTIEMFPRRKTIFPVDMSGESGRERTFEVGVQLAATIDVQDLTRFLQDGDIDVPSDVMQLLEICLRSSASTKPHCHLSESPIYSDDASVDYTIPQSGELWISYQPEVKLCQKVLMPNLETTCTFFKKRQPVMKLFEEVVGRKITEDFQLEQWMFTKMRNSIVNLKVKPTHRQSSRKHKCVGLTNKSAADVEFELESGSSISVAKYWDQRYNPLKYPQLPCLDVSKRHRINYLPLEVCEIVAGQRRNRLNEEQSMDSNRIET